jgi:hypothetical protein
MEQLNVVKLEIFTQRERVEEELKKLQALVDNEVKDTTFTWYSDAQEALFTKDIFSKQKRVREEDVISEESQKVVLEVDGLQTSPSFGQIVN